MASSANLSQTSREQPAAMNPLANHAGQHRPLAHPLVVEPARQQEQDKEQQSVADPNRNRTNVPQLDVAGLSPLDKVTAALNANAKYQDVLTSLLQALKVRDEQIRTLKRRVADQRVQVPDQEFVDQWWARVDGDLPAANSAAPAALTTPAFQPWPARVGIQYSFFADEAGVAPPPHPDEVERAARTPLFADPAKLLIDNDMSLKRLVSAEEGANGSGPTSAPSSAPESTTLKIDADRLHEAKMLQVKARQQKEVEQLREEQLLRVKHINKLSEIEIDQTEEWETLLAEQKVQDMEMEADHVKEIETEQFRIQQQLNSLKAYNATRIQQHKASELAHQQKGEAKQLIKQHRAFVPSTRKKSFLWSARRAIKGHGSSATEKAAGPRAAMRSARSAAWAFRYYHEFLRAQGSYNERIGRKFTPAEDDLLHQAVHIHGPDQWTSVADLLGTRDAKQCLQRWKAQDPAIRRGRFTRDEDAALRAAVTQCGEKWSDVARLVLGRTDMQCRERYYNVIKARMEVGPVPTGEWTAEEDAKLLELVAKEGTKWSSVAEQMPGRTDGMVRLRYAKLRTEIEMGYREHPVGVEELPVDVRSQRVLEADPLDELVQAMQRQFLLPMMAGTVAVRPLGWADPEAEERKRAALEACRFALEHGVFPEGE
ncbi:hypothetical protein AMAG_04267 [Allomyces macrogynus ATCC 38327]|uniref:Uncharacterized protein n=1 Tax=Allomyces macrogynus (strain ATCC 38327) TaxID=578462 RepID=A0A0L0S7Y5_ALLM3|nr:hypothetical protein AMAG_04267 [Allomyces macrogynus ATCC 38327]|eukprot:KNE58713.1 hypothetical protein AMAG_04267 [Allomyces macrogynus ATCC 38327]